MSHILSSWTEGFQLHKPISTLQSPIAFLQPEDFLRTPPRSLARNKLSTYPCTVSHCVVCCEQDGFSLTCVQPTWVRVLFMLVKIGWARLVCVSLFTKLLASCFIVILKWNFFHASNSSCQCKDILSICLLCTWPHKLLLSTEELMPTGHDLPGFLPKQA